MTAAAFVVACLAFVVSMWAAWSAHRSAKAAEAAERRDRERRHDERAPTVELVGHREKVGDGRYKMGAMLTVRGPEPAYDVTLEVIAPPDVLEGFWAGPDDVRPVLTLEQVTAGAQHFVTGAARPEARRGAAVRVRVTMEAGGDEWVALEEFAWPSTGRGVMA